MNMTKVTVIALLLAGFSAVGMAATPIPAPEIDPGTGLNAIALLGGLSLIIGARRRK